MIVLIIRVFILKFDIGVKYILNCCCVGLLIYLDVVLWFFMLILLSVVFRIIVVCKINKIFVS